jgi:hypothetical protein
MNRSQVSDVVLKGYVLLKWRKRGRGEEYKNRDELWPVPLLGCGLDSTNSRKGQMRALVNTVINQLVAYISENFLQ